MELESTAANGWLIRHLFRPPTKLRERKVFSRLCLFTGEGSHVAMIHGALDLTVQDTRGPPSQPQLYPLTWDLTMQGPKPPRPQPPLT